jgi:asparaginyl-tRNA synthetase
MQKVSVIDARKPAAVGWQVTLLSEFRTRRDSTGGFSLLELSDGSCLGDIQIPTAICRTANRKSINGRPAAT